MGGERGGGSRKVCGKEDHRPIVATLSGEVFPRADDPVIIIQIRDVSYAKLSAIWQSGNGGRSHTYVRGTQNHCSRSATTSTGSDPMTRSAETAQ